jgi:hypothetical protein
VDVHGHSSGFITRFLPNCVLISCFSIFLWLFTELYCKELDRSFLILNLYGAYEGKEFFREKVFSLNVFKPESLIIGGNLNFTLSRDEIWGVSAREDKLAGFFQDKLEMTSLVDVMTSLVDVEPTLMRPTWCNNRSGVEEVSK